MLIIMHRIACRALLLGIFALLIRAGSFQDESVISVRSTTATNIIFSVTTSSSIELVYTPVPTPTVRFSSVLHTTLANLEATPLGVITMTTQRLSIVAANATDQFISGTPNCVCDLLVDRCDVSCCCDQDCTLSELNVFDCTNSKLPTNVCLDVDSVLWTSLSQCSCEDESLLCIVREQDPSMFEFMRRSPIVDSSQFITKLLFYSAPGDTFAYQTQSSSVFNSFYKIGDPVLIIQNETSLGFLTIPGQLNGLHCHDSNPITYLKDEVHKCERQLSPLSVVCASLSAVYLIENVTIAKVPLSTGDLQNYTSRVIPEINIKCSAAGELVPCLIAVPTYDNNTCVNALLKATYNIIHNGTGQILGVDVDIVLGEIGSNENSYIQTYAVRFQHQDKPTLIYQRSGNPGYVFGQPVLAGSLSSIGVIDISIDSNAWLSVRGSSRRCEIDYPTIIVRFREDLVTSCVLQLPLVEIWEDCEGARSRAIEILTPSPQLTYIGIFGDSNPLNISEWIQLINSTAPTSISDESRLAGALCNSFPTFLQVNILYSFIGHHASPQAIISGIEFTYHTESIKLSKSDVVMIPLKTAVVFTDISAPPVQALDSISSTIGRLPQDFLYPLFVSQAVAHYTITLQKLLVIGFMIIATLL